MYIKYPNRCQTNKHRKRKMGARRRIKAISTHVTILHCQINFAVCVCHGFMSMVIRLVLLKRIFKEEVFYASYYMVLSTVCFYENIFNDIDDITLCVCNAYIRSTGRSLNSGIVDHIT